MARILANQAVITLQEMFLGSFSDKVLETGEFPGPSGGARPENEPSVSEAIGRRVFDASRRLLPMPEGLPSQGALPRLAGERWTALEALNSKESQKEEAGKGLEISLPRRSQ